MLARALCLSLLACGLFAAPRALAEEPWKPWSDKGGVKWEKRDVEGSSYPELRATKEVAQPLAKCLEVVWASVSDLTSTKDHQKRVIRQSADELVVYQQISVAVITNRDYTVRIWKAPPAADGTVEVRYRTANELGPAADPKFVRLEAIRGAWSLTPLASGRTRVSYLAYSEAGGSVPAAFARGPQRSRFESDFTGVVGALEATPPTAPAVASPAPPAPDGGARETEKP